MAFKQAQIQTHARNRQSTTDENGEQNGELKSGLRLDQETLRGNILIHFLNATWLIIGDSECELETIFFSYSGMLVCPKKKIKLNKQSPRHLLSVEETKHSEFPLLNGIGSVQSPSVPTVPHEWMLLDCLKCTMTVKIKAWDTVVVWVGDRRK